MKKFILAPDSFKGTMSAKDICDIIAKRLTRSFPDSEILSIPIADGGEGTVDCFLAISGSGVKIPVATKGALQDDIVAYYGYCGDFSVVEMASVVGLPLLEGRKDPLNTSTYGLGALILDAINRGSKRILFGLGGSSTNDCGAGLAAALGAVFMNKEGKPFIPTGGTLAEVHSIDTSAVKKRLQGVEIIGIYDTSCPMYGKNGAAYIYAPQKGATPEQVAYLDAQLQTFAETIKVCLGKDVSFSEGSGAAGATGAGILAFLGGRLEKGIDVVMNASDMEGHLEGCDYVITGEGKIDAQSLSGKAVSGVAGLAKKHGVPVIVIAGRSEGCLDDFYQIGVSHIITLVEEDLPIEVIKRRCKNDLERAVGRMIELL